MIVNTKLKQHNRLVYSDEATRHVADQIDILYWNAVSKAGSGTNIDPDEALAVEKGTDLCSDE